MTSTHDQTQAHLYGLCGCDQPVDDGGYTADDMARDYAAADREIANLDDEDNIGRRPRRSVQARRRARRRF